MTSRFSDFLEKARTSMPTGAPIVNQKDEKAGLLPKIFPSLMPIGIE